MQLHRWIIHSEKSSKWSREWHRVRLPGHPGTIRISDTHQLHTTIHLTGTRSMDVILQMLSQWRTPPVGSNNVRRSDAVAWRTSARQTQSVWLRPLVVKSPISAVVAICDVVAAWRDGHIIKRPASNGVRSRRIGVCAAPPGAIARPPHQEMNIKAPLPREEVPSSTCGGRKLADPLRRRLAVFRDQSPETLAFPGVFLTPPFSD